MRFLVDSATYTLLPEEVWQEIELKPMREHTFMLAEVAASQGRYLNVISCFLRGKHTLL